MKNILGKKQSVKNEDWIKAVEQIEELVSRSEIESLVDSTIEVIRRNTDGKNVAYAWSGGKDSIVLEKLCEKAGIHSCMMGVCDLEYPMFVKWINEHKPVGLEVINTGQNMEWLVKHPEMLFPADSKVAARWFSIVQHRAQAKYYREHDLDMILLGRRRADGNYCGKGGDTYTDGKGVTRYSPLAGWKHEEILGFLHYYDIALPPIYDWPNGYLCGTHPWPARQWTGSVGNAWKEIHEIDPEVVRDAAQYIDSAKEFLHMLVCE